jgi:RNA polymerase sigma factor (sigma-70 family)
VSPDPRARFEQLFDETRTDLLAYLVRRSPSAEDAADLLAETYLVAWRRMDAVPAGERARLWLFGVARNLLRKSAGKRRSAHALTERLAGQLRAAAPSVDDEPRAAVLAALRSLSETDRELVTLTAWEGLTPREVAVVTGMSANVVRVRLHRARARLRRRLEADSRSRAVPPYPDRRVAGDSG